MEMLRNAAFKRGETREKCGKYSVRVLDLTYRASLLQKVVKKQDLDLEMFGWEASGWEEDSNKPGM